MNTEYILERGEEHDFYYNSQWYIAYTRLYNNGDQDIEVYLRENPDIQVDGDVYEYAWKLFEDQGFI
jgi:hypothetical protein